MAPNLHWPDTMFSYDHATKVMYTCDGAPGRQGRAGPRRLGRAGRRSCSAVHPVSTRSLLHRPACCTPSAHPLHTLLPSAPHPTTAAAFGMHYCTDDPYDSQLEPLEAHYRFYYDCLMLPNAKWVEGAGRRGAGRLRCSGVVRCSGARPLMRAPSHQPHPSCARSDTPTQPVLPHLTRAAGL